MCRKLLLALFLITALLPMGNAFGHAMSEADMLRASEGGYVEFIRQGAVHMVTGYDHLLFLFGVLFFLTGFKKVVKFVTAFTLGHCITLISATFLGIQANYFLVDAVIALTVCYKGFDNIGGFKKYFNMESPHLLGMVFIFGLIHGFGLSTRLQTLTIGEGWDLLMKILCFNLGVELGQIFALTIILFLLSAWRHTKSFERFAMAANTGLIIIGALLCLMQLHGYTHEQHLNSYPFNAYAHQHAHEDMAAGMHVDEPGGTPHGAHDDHAHGDSPELPPGWHMDPGDTVPHAPHDNPELPEGWHMDEGDPIPHRSHDDHSHAEGGEHSHAQAGGHSHAANQDKVFAKTIDKIFDVRSGYKNARDAKTIEDVLAAQAAVADVQKLLVTLQGQVEGVPHVDAALYASYLKSATETATAIAVVTADSDVAQASELVKNFDRSILNVEELVMHGKALEIPEGFHVDAENATPHKH